MFCSLSYSTSFLKKGPDGRRGPPGQAVSTHRDVHRHFEGQGFKWKKWHFSYLFIYFLNKTLNILGMCNIDKKYINIFCVFIDNDRQYFADCADILRTTVDS